MPSQGLQGKKFIGKVVEGFDPQQRGRYYVHVPDFQPHMPESKGILMPNATHNSRISYGSSGDSTGQAMPLQVGDQVQVVCLKDDISSARIEERVSDDHPKSDTGAGKSMSAEPSGQSITGVIKGLPDKIPFGSAGNDLVAKFTEILNSGGAMAQELLGSVKDKLGDVYNKVAEGFKTASEAVSQLEEQFNQAVQNVQEKVAEIGEGVVDNFSKAKDEITKIGEQFAISAEEQIQGVVGNVEDVIKQIMEKKPEGEESQNENAGQDGNKPENGENGNSNGGSSSGNNNGR